MLVSRDTEGIRLAAKELFVAMLDSQDDKLRKRIELNGGDVRKVLGDAGLKLTLADAYYQRVGFVLWLMANLELGYTASELGVSPDESEAIRVVKKEAEEFARTYPQCESCGCRDKKGYPKCRYCGAKLSGIQESTSGGNPNVYRTPSANAQGSRR
jgi:hypothetical protein